MGEELVESLESLVRSDSFSAVITLENLYEVDWKNIEGSLRIPEKSEQWAVEYKPTSIAPGCTTLTCSKSQRFQPPDLSKPAKRPSTSALWNFLEQVVKDPPKGPLHYYVGPRLTEAFDGLLHSGPVLSELGDIPGVTSVYDHLGGKGSGCAFHQEDAHFWSCNLTLFGWKVWILIKEHHTTKFENYIRTFRSDTCAQFVRHQGLLFAPSELHSKGIEFDIRCTGPGDLLITKPRQYHAVVNFTDNYAISTNFVPANEVAFPPKLRVCSSCGLSNFYVLGELRQHISSQQNSHHTERLQRLQKIKKYADEILEEDPCCKMPEFDPNCPPNEEVFRLAAVVRSRAAVSQFYSIVAASRKNGDLRTYKVTKSFEGNISQCVRNIKNSETVSDLQTVRRRHDQIHLYTAIEESKNGQIRCSSDFLNVVCKEVNWTKRMLRDHKLRGRYWKSICEPLDGLLCFIPTSRNAFKVTQDDYINLSQKPTDLDSFHSLLQDSYTRELCSAGRALQDSFMGALLPKFKWETEDVRRLLALPENELLYYMKFEDGTP
ncbi:hypothetical protein MHUMG1_09616 [Metarhizium humberi]|uniref:JmjC domain-containing protein n=1 Tax=Metarhizium humberi TaxID=2596975 RepID=A0A9P8M2Y8_9HYPO|nr:hypothetical protein MHUMG1_09616 [Metarhizium humberi]